MYIDPTNHHFAVSWVDLPKYLSAWVDLGNLGRSTKVPKCLGRFRKWTQLPGPTFSARGAQKRLEDEFALDPAHAGADFRPWAFENVVLTILNIVNDQLFSKSIEAVSGNVSRRWNKALRHYNISLGALAFLFGDTIIASRPCAEATTKLCKSHPANSIIDLYLTYRAQCLIGQVSQKAAVKRFRQAIQSISQHAWPLKHSQPKGKRAATASDDANASDTDMHTDIGPQAPSRVSESPDCERSQKLTAFDESHDGPPSSEAAPQYAHLASDERSPFQFNSIALPSSIDCKPRYKHQRSLSNTGFIVSPCAFEPLERPTKLPRISVIPAAPKTAHYTSRSRIRRVDLQDILQSASRLDGATWLNDTVMQTISQRLESTTVGIIHSLTIAAKQVTERGRLQLQTTIAKSKVLLFLNHNRDHWILFLWEPVRNLVTEFNSISTVSSNAPSADPSTASPADAPSQTVLTFLRWVTNDASLQVTLQKAKCPQQPNAFDCGVYVLAFAEKVAKNNEIPPTLDGNLERVCLGGAVLTSWNCVPRAEELVPLGPHIPRTTVERVALVRLLRHRQTNLRALMQSYETQPNQTSVTSLRTGQIHSLTEAEWRDCQQSTLAGIILNEMTEHRRDLESALRSHNTVNMLETVQPLDSALREQIKGFIAAMDARDAVRHEEAAGAGMLGKQAEDRKTRNCAAMYMNAVLAEGSWDESAESDAQKRHLARESTQDGYVRSCVHILILRYMMTKFRLMNGTGGR
ncbi:uncharacterized protein LY79DRAFT_584595 [Colletotrichum navitas]|uniref:Ubiquitin-like protease family profile domain-containing protein n=1 Tax=Colletotrichum navitas TaxID=681940 RepID=A0AAD8PL17_9PEZI|nr:uncharacterized protein LY79DRAFT_584595 [Colletotrichum navitas]KAK1569645.1 hypothetical protein LY79DRAFT_584595 [Colletotrichum navitas]